MLAVLGSSRKGSASGQVAEEVMKAAKGNGYEISVYYPGLMNLKGCMGCGACKVKAADCVIKDDMEAYFRELHECDALLIAAPNYYGQPAGHMITFLNRHYCMMGSDRKSRLEKPVRLVGIFSQGAPAAMKAYDANYDWYLEVLRQIGMEPAGKIVVGRGSDLSPEGELMDRARALGASL